LVRTENQDSFYIDPEKGLFIVSDGMGGQAAGSVASQIVTSLLPRTLGNIDFDTEPDKNAMDILREQVRELSKSMRKESEKNPLLTGMGATVVAAVVRESYEDLILASLGDSRAYLLRNKKLLRITKDHSVAQLLVDLEQLSSAAAERHPSRNQLFRFMGMPLDATPDIFCVKTLPGDVFLLCSDGLTGMLTEHQILKKLLKRESFLKISRNLIEHAKEAGGDDNITVVLFKI
jgi:protein phosphatase